MRDVVHKYMNRNFPEVKRLIKGIKCCGQENASVYVSESADKLRFIVAYEIYGQPPVAARVYFSVSKCLFLGEMVADLHSQPMWVYLADKQFIGIRNAQAAQLVGLVAEAWIKARYGSRKAR